MRLRQAGQRERVLDTRLLGRALVRALRGEDAEGRFAAGGQQQAQEAVELAVGEPFTVDLGVDEIGEEVARGFARRASTSGCR